MGKTMITTALWNHIEGNPTLFELMLYSKRYVQKVSAKWRLFLGNHIGDIILFLNRLAMLDTIKSGE
jgi:hypothetical protein